MWFVIVGLLLFVVGLVVVIKTGTRWAKASTSGVFTAVLLLMTYTFVFSVVVALLAHLIVDVVK